MIHIILEPIAVELYDPVCSGKNQLAGFFDFYKVNDLALWKVILML